MGNGEDSGTWGSITNTNWNLIEQSVAGVQTITMANANYTLTNLNGVSDEARNMVLVVNGTNSAIYQIIAPLVNKFYVVSNQTVGGYAITIGGASGSIITIPNSTTVQVYCDGSNFYSAQTSSAGNFNVNGNLSVNGNETIGGTLTVTGTSAFTGNSTFTGIPSGPTASAGTNTTQLATTAFVNTAVSNAFPSGTRLVFSQAAAPTGWTQDTSDTANNRMMRVVTPASGTGNAVGGSYDPTVMSVVPSHTHTYSASTSNTNIDHTHTFNGSGSASGSTNSASANIQDPGHQHFSYTSGAPNGGGAGNCLSYYQGAGGPQPVQSAVTGISDSGHTHSFSAVVSVSGTTGSMSQNNPHNHAISGTTDNGSSQTNWTPRYVNLIICQKN